MVDISAFTNDTTDPLIVAAQVTSLILLYASSHAALFFAASWCGTMEDRVLGNEIDILSGRSVALMLSAGFIYIGGIISVMYSQHPVTTSYILWLRGCLRGLFYAGVFVAGAGTVAAGRALVTHYKRRRSTKTPDPGAGTELDEIVPDGTNDQRDTTNPNQIHTANNEVIGE